MGTNQSITYSNWRRGEPNDYTVAGHAIFGDGEDYTVYMNNPRHNDRRTFWNDAPFDFNNAAWGSVQTVCWKELTQTELDEILNPPQPESMFSANHMDWLWTSSADSNVNMTNFENLEVQMTSSGYYDCVTGCTRSVEDLTASDNAMDAKLNNAPASFEGNIVRFKNAGETHHFLCTRNNNFSNRAQKSHIKVVPDGTL